MKDTHSEKALSNKTPVLAKSMIKSIWVVVYLIHSLEELLQLNFFFFSKKKNVLTGKNSAIGLFCTSQSIYLNIGVWQGEFVWK